MSSVLPDFFSQTLRFSVVERYQELSEKNIVYRDPGWQCVLGDKNICIFIN